MKKRKGIILIPDGESEFSVKVLRCLSRSPEKLSVNILSDSPWSAVRVSKHTNKYIQYRKPESDFYKAEQIIEAATKINAQVIMPVDVETTKLISQHRNLFRGFSIPPMASPNNLEIAADKGKLTRFMLANEISAPTTVFCNDTNTQDFKKLSFPVLLKKTDARGGGGIRLCSNYEILEDTLKNINDPDVYIVQPFINGYDIDCSVLCKEGEVLAYTIQKGIIEPYSQFAPPAGIRFLLHDQVLSIAKQLMRALNWSGVAHIDMRYDENEKIPKVIEINPRFWGSLTGSFIAGINFPYLMYLLAIDEKLPELNYKVGQVYIHHKAAIKLAFNNLFTNKKDKIKISGTGIEHVLADPLPEFMNFLQGIKWVT